jgi:predicted transcriptional regulator
MEPTHQPTQDTAQTTNDPITTTAPTVADPAIPGIVTDPVTPAEAPAVPEPSPEPPSPTPTTETPITPPAEPPTEVTQPVADTLPRTEAESSNTAAATPEPDVTQLPPEAGEQVEVIPVPVPPTVPSPITNDIPPAVAALTNEELRIASVLYVKRHQKERSQKAVAARQATQKIHLDEILNYMSSHNPTKLINVAYACNLSPEQASHYLRVLRQQGKITGEGHGPSRIFTLV